ncbi:hypothetical protein F7725_024149 [Dissostichus mawsoni]|uniref:EGF-like domain-containing protein n=1 Tax=Dissostichus mawsoni TaxID=36200 RepID=A0A7J5Y1G0_DISMA|nr:hypothetical protein F7725_024149 [Dissostichus mawsoni]
MVSCCPISFLGVLWSLCCIHLPAVVASLITWKLVAAPALAALTGQSPPCEKRKGPCDPNPCRNGGVCEPTPEGFVCRCPEKFGGVNCESRVVYDCMLHACQEEQLCTAGERASDCVCADGSVVPACRRLQNLCSPSPCLNNATLCLCPRMDWRVLSICRRCLPDKTKQLFEWSHMHHNKSAILSSTIHLQVPPRLHR